ncbi:UNVERIFIED_CONTAM: hypothetical protein Scaly_3110700 [Sesamum calycinum]|uniref:CID domain-containing protein n=1 Tax=Sesamum calycinum TaxID=2727403 RepID=A0AAW2JL76_9LAMI
MKIALSAWCILHHKKADQIIATWDRHIRCPEVVQKVPLLFLANDILPSNKTEVNRFITRFWKILPSALKEIVENGKVDERKAVFRLIRIWEREKVFGSLSQSLKDILLGEGSPPLLDLGRKCYGSVTITKRDEQSIRTKLSIGGSAEKIVSAFESVLHKHVNEDKEMRECKSAVHHVKKLEKHVDKALKKAKDSLRNTFTKRLKEEEENLEKSIDKLRSFEANRVVLVFQLQDALREQVCDRFYITIHVFLGNTNFSILGLPCSYAFAPVIANILGIRTSEPPETDTVAEAQAAETAKMIQCLGDKEDRLVVELKLTFANAKQENKSISEMAAELADKLVASSSSQEIMTSVLAKFVAERAKNTDLMTSSLCNNSMSKSENLLMLAHTYPSWSSPN